MVQIDSVSPPQGEQGQRAPHTGFRADIEGLRAVPLVAILLFHADVPGVGGGFVGPDEFFIISGFLITGNLWRELSTAGTIQLRRFFGGRARRLLPTSAFIGVVIMIASAILLPPLQARSVMGDGIASALYVGNYWFIARGVDYFASNVAPSPFQHYWTLGVEEQFYLLWPPMIIVAAWLIRRARRRTGTHANSKSANSSKRPYLVLLSVITVVSFGLSLWATSAMPPAAYFSLPTRAWDLAVGGLVALTADQWRRLPARAATITGWAGLALLVVICNVLSPTTPYPGTAALWPLLGTVMVIGAGCAAPSLGCGRFLAWSPMRAIGRASYSWYLWHWPVLVLAPVLLGHPLGLVGRLAAVLFSGGLGFITLRLIENPLRFAAPLRRSPLRSLAVGGVATAIAVCVGLVSLLWVPAPVGRGTAATAMTITEEPPVTGQDIEQYNAAVQRAFAQVQAAVAESAEMTDVPSNLDPSLADAAGEPQRLFFNGCLRNFLELGQPECAMGDTASKTTVALIGDSNGAMWAPGFQQLATQRHWRLELMAKGNCPLLNLPPIIFGREYTECEQWRSEVTARLLKEHPKLVVLSAWRRYGAPDVPARFKAYDPAWIDSLTHIVQQVHSIGAQVLVLGPIPDPQSAVPSCVSDYLDDAMACSPLRSQAVNPAGIAAEYAAVRASGGQYADVTDLFCTPERCPVIIGNTLVYLDRNHETLEYSKLLAPVLGALADRALVRG